MGKFILTLLTTLFISSLLHAQKEKVVDRFDIGRYQIRLTKNSDDTYGYSISKGKQLIIQQLSKPYFSVPVGFHDKENALKLAKWQVTQLRQNKEVEKYLNIEEAKKIGISGDDLELKLSTNQN